MGQGVDKLAYDITGSLSSLKIVSAVEMNIYTNHRVW